jgi:hypothetical protein
VTADVQAALATLRDALTYMPPHQWQRYDLATLALATVEQALTDKDEKIARFAALGEDTT